jgi:hypothetical protein
MVAHSIGSDIVKGKDREELYATALKAGLLLLPMSAWMTAGVITKTCELQFAYLERLIAHATCWGQREGVDQSSIMAPDTCRPVPLPYPKSCRLASSPIM